MGYDHRAIESKWQEFWEKYKVFKTKNPENQDSERPKKYILDMFPYPSGEGLHVGHPKGYTATDIVSRYYHAKGYNVLHPMGFDAFGLPAENYAIKTGTHPAVTTKKNIETFITQMKSLGFSYDWDRMVDTTDPGYYQWTQWIFTRLFEQGLAYEQDLPINYCPSCKTGLANEEVLSDNTCERCGTKVERRAIRQWVLKITEYADRLIEDLDSLDWPQGIKEMQRNWIGKSEGCEFTLRKAMTKKGGLPLSVNGGGLNCPAKISSKNKEARYFENEGGHNIPKASLSEDNICKSTPEVKNKKDGICISKNGVGLNCPAKFPSSDISIFDFMPKVKKKNEILRDIDVTVVNNERKIILNSVNIFKHFSSKGLKEFRYRRSLLNIIYHSLELIHFENDIGYVIFKDFVIQVVLGQQKNGNYFVKTYYVSDKLTEAYRAYIAQNKKPVVLILHGWEGKAESNWFMATKSELEKKGYTVQVPNLPQSNTPNMEEQIEFLQTFIPYLNEQSIIIGHSLGGFLGAKFVESLDTTIGSLILVAPTYPGVAEHMGITARPSLNTHEKAFIEYVRHEVDITRIGEHTKNTILHISEDDPYIDFSSVKAYYSGIANTVVRKYTDKKHFNAQGECITFPELLQDIDSPIMMRKATKEDYERVLQIRKETGLHTVDFAQDQFFVAKKGDEIAGFIRTQKIDEKTSELGALFVVEKFRKEKLGYRLIAYAINHTDSETFLMDCKPELREYYEKYGFTFCAGPTDFQMEKLRKLWASYGKYTTDEEIREKTIFMKINKEKVQKPFLYHKEGKKILAIILHGWDDVETRTNWHWMPSLKLQLESVGYEVILEQLPGNNAPDLEKQLAFLEQYKSRMDENSIVIGHSMGGFIGMHFVERLDKKIGKLICVAPAFYGLTDLVDVKQYPGGDIGYKSLQKSYSSDRIKEHVEDWHVFLSENDPEIPFHEIKKHFDGLGVSLTCIPNAGHFCSSSGYDTFNALFEYIVPHIRVYTTRIDTVYGMTYAVLAPDHPQVHEFITDEARESCEQYIEEARRRSDQERTNEGREKTGVFTGSYVINPFNGESVPLWIADYVLGNYGTGAVMAVPAHDERDWEFAKKYGLGIKCSVLTAGSISDVCMNLRNQGKLDEAYTYEWNNHHGLDGVLWNYGEFIGIKSEEARKVLTEKAEKEGFGKKKINYKLRDWLFSRQRYWGEPIPLIHIAHGDYEKLPRIHDPSEAIDPDTAYVYDKKGTPKRCKNCTCTGGCTKLIINGKTFSKVYDGLYSKIIIDSRLPLTLPEVSKYEPAGDGNSPLVTVSEWVHVRLAENLMGKRETNTMPQWGGSCWYYLRYMDPENHEALASREALEYWGMVDEYVGGAEHAVLHLLYARFWHKFLYDIGVVSTKEPFQKLTNVGMISAYAYERMNGGLVAVDLVEEREGKFYEKSTGEEVKQIVAKMSKSLKNVINPNEIVREYGADTLRLYEMSMSAFTDSAPWNPEAIIGMRRFLDKVYNAFTVRNKQLSVSSNQGTINSEEGKDVKGAYTAKEDMKTMKLLHKTIKKVSEDIREYKFNTAISALIILMNEGIPSDREFASEWQEKFLILLHPFAPHMAEELWSVCHPVQHMRASAGSGSQKERGDTEVSGRSMRHDTVGAGMTHGENQPESIYNIPWPEYDEFMLAEDEVTIAIQINGKLRGTLTFLNGVAQEEVSEVARADPSIAKWLEGKEIIKEIFIPNKMLSIVIK